MLTGSDQALLPPLPLLLHRLAHSEDTADLAGFAHDHPVLPLCCQIADLTTLTHHDNSLPSQAKWTVKDQHVSLQQADADDDAAVELTGALDVELNSGRPVDGRFLNALRLQEARAVIDQQKAGDWDRLLQHDPSMPPLSALNGEPLDQFADSWQAWNPLPIQHNCLIQAPLDGGRAPWALIDDEGGQYPIQVVQSPTGQQVLSQVPLGPLECRRLYPHDDPVDACWWEVSPKLLDNGRLRLEFTDQGGIRRACLDGTFLPLAGPGFMPVRDGQAFGTFLESHVVEDGPVRARVSFSWRDESGTAKIVYSLHANEANWHVQTSWLGRGKAPDWQFLTMWRNGLWRWGYAEWL